MGEVSIGGLVGLVSLILIFVGFVRDLQGGQVKAALTTVLAWVCGVVAVLLFAASDFGDTVVIEGLVLGDMGFASLVLVGVMLASTAGTAWTVVKALDGSQSAAKPSLGGGDKPPE